MLVRVQDLGGLNQRFGGPHTDKLLLNIANLLNAHKEKYASLDSTLARIRGGEFALLCPGVTHGEMLDMGNSLCQADGLLCHRYVRPTAGRLYQHGAIQRRR